MTENGLLSTCKFSEDVWDLLQDVRVIAGDNKAMMNSIAASQNSIAASASLMATTNAKAEDRYKLMDVRLQEVNDRAAGKGQIPIVSHFLIVGSVLLISLLMITWVTKQTIEGSLSTLKVTQEK